MSEKIVEEIENNIKKDRTRFELPGDEVCLSNA